MTRKKKLIVFLIVFFLVFLSCVMVNRTFASYRSNIITSGETDAAKWELLVEGDRNSIDLVPGGSSVSYILSVTSKSEVSSTYSIIIDNLPNGVQIALDEGDYVDPVDGIITFTDCGRFNATDSFINNEHRITFRATSSSGNVFNRELNIDIDVKQDNI